MEARTQRVLIWAGPASLIIWVGAFLLIAGWIPPTAPSDSAVQIAHFYEKDTNAIKLGMVIAMAGSALLVPWAVAISGQLKRIDGARALATIQMVSCSLLSLEFITPIGLWMAAAFRVGQTSPQVTQAFHDGGWILFLTVIWSVEVQMWAIAWAVLIDKRDEPVLPRWVGYLNLWAAVLIFPAGIVLFFKDAPFGWNGIFGFFIPLTGFTLWMLGTTYAVERALRKQIAEGSEPG